MKIIKGLDLLMRHLRDEYRKDERAGGTLRLRGWSSFDEYQIFFALPRIYNVDNVIESGTCNGASALCFSHNLPQGGKLYTWDIVDKYKVWTDTHLEERIVAHVDPIGFQSAGNVLATIPGKRLWFIDGDHTTEGRTKDINTAMPFVREGDVMVFHDTIRWNTVQPVLEATFPGKCKRLYYLRTENGMGIVEF